LNTVWNGACDAALLTPFVPVPGAAAGCGFGEWSLQKPLSAYGEDVTLSLSEVSTQAVSIDYEVAQDFTVLAAGTVSFAPGDLRKKIAVPALAGTPRDLVRVTLTGATGGEFTTPRNLFYLVSPEAAGGPQTLIAKGAAWRFLDDGSNQGTAWRELPFNDSTWAAGNAELGYGDGDEVTLVRRTNAGGAQIATTYFRHSFNVANPGAFGTLDINLLRDDGAIVYLNGVEEFRSNIDPGAVSFDTFTGIITQGGDEDLFYPKSIPASGLRAGTNVVAVEVHQANNTSSDVSFDLELVAHPSIPLVFLLHKSGEELNLLWQGEADLILQSSRDLADDWIDLPDATSPLLLTPGEADPRLFFRLAR
jgi:hypothetical protein